jgi:hypothetical protein
MDVYVKIVLTVIAACLVLQVAQGFGLAGTPGSGQVDSSSSETARRYAMQAVPMARALVRFDMATGRTWMMPLQDEEARFWTLVRGAPSGPAVDEGASSASE